MKEEFGGTNMVDEKEIYVNIPDTPTHWPCFTLAFFTHPQQISHYPGHQDKHHASGGDDPVDPYLQL
jgi:hypothetical protein